MKENMEDYIPSAFNGLMYLSTFRDAFQRSELGVRVSIEHMETFFFMCTVHKQEGVELRHLQEQLGYPQAKMHRTADTLMQMGWFNIEPSPTDARQKVVSMTDKGMRFFGKISKYLHPDRPAANPYEEKAYELSGMIKYEAEQKLNVSTARTDEKWAKTIKDVVKRAFGAVPEIGTGYVKTHLGIVTLAVLMKRTYVSTTDELAMKMYGMGNEQLEELLTPTPKAGGLANVDNPLQIMDAMIEKYGIEGVHGNPQLQIHYHQLANKVAKMQKEKNTNVNQQMEVLNKRRAAIMRQLVENHKNVRRVNKQLDGSDLIGTTKADLKRTFDMHTRETGKLTALLDKIGKEREIIEAQIQNNLSKGIGALSGIQDTVKDLQDMKKFGLLSQDNPFFKKDNK
jgi:DNA-binding MarR family transcriptional regulator